MTWPPRSGQASFGRLVAASRELVAGRLAERTTKPLDALAAESRAVPLQAGIVLLETLGRVLGIEPERLRARDSLEALFDVRPEHLSTQLAGEWRALEPPPGLDPLSAVLLKELALVTPRAGWEAIAEAVAPTPESDRDWLNLMLGLRVDEWVRTWAPVVKVK